MPSPIASWRRPRLRGAGLVLLVLGLLAFRTVYGLSAGWSPDAKQIYLLGLKFYTTGTWPYFGPDVVYTDSQIPGALQALLVGLPLFLGGLPEAPTILLNLLSLGALGFFAWYLARRFPRFPKWLVWTWVAICPWTMLYGTRVVNPSYVLPFSVLFFVAVFEAYPLYRERLLPIAPCFLMMGLATTAIMQLHLSWVLLPPFVVGAFVLQKGEKGGKGRMNPTPTVAFVTGAALGLATLVPTFLVYGVTGTGGTEQNIVFNPSHWWKLPDVIVRFLAFASFEVPRVLGINTAARLAVLRGQPWMIPPTVLLLLLGLAQLGFFTVCFFRRDGDDEWRRIRLLTSGAMALVYLSFLFSIKGPSAHTFYLMFPLAMLYSFHCYDRLPLQARGWRLGAAVLLLSGLAFHAGVAVHNLRTASLHAERALAAQAIGKRDYRILGLRRADELGRGY
ncbi:MAG TPA: hypothetical protein VGA42_08320 [Gemmatimonadales bacterium]